MSFARFLALLLPVAMACSSATQRNVLPNDPNNRVVGEGPSAKAPTTCEEAVAQGSYIGCEYWPTVTANSVDPTFDYAVAVVNVGAETADVSVERGSFSTKASVAPGVLTKIYLPWVLPLKGPSYVSTTSTPTETASVFEKGGAYHLVSSKPVVVYQFNAIEYQPEGGPKGKDWDTCVPMDPDAPCFSYTNDASLLLPSVAFGTTYRVAGYPSSSVDKIFHGFVSIVGASDSTTVTVELPSGGNTLASANGKVLANKGTASYTLDAGDVLQLSGAAGTDLSGALVVADKPVQVLAGHGCGFVPAQFYACDHLEETMLPAESLGKRYVVAPPSRPDPAARQGHVVRFIGNVDGTRLTYSPSRPPGCPETLDAGQMAECKDPSGMLTLPAALGAPPLDATSVVARPFVVEGDHEFVVSTFLVGQVLLYAKACVSQPTPVAFGDCLREDESGHYRSGDPSQSVVLPTEQFRTNYTFLATDDYEANYVDVTVEDGTTLTLDGDEVSDEPEAIAQGWGVVRLRLGAGKQGAHTLQASKPVGIQVLGYGSFTSYAYPGGGDLHKIAPPPSIK